ncbi:kinesin-like protein KIN-UB isoform X3 [Dendrobium catenatum]|uniref:kinesin-like protein KIN-UB isoform X3 n=1 Tax=Dendrobium catenatum TaxID=906689 RepID=UPI00109F3390|nr:kinesin-like protein KIN-UB isoform X3 [Dendrobium catenatum]
MASGSYRNGTPKTTKPDRSTSSTYTTPKPTAKSRVAAGGGANVRRSSAVPLIAKDDAGVPGRVRVAVRLRPQNSEELVADADFADCVELQSELKRLKLRKNNWESETYEFDEVLTESASQKRVYEVVAKPVVESVLEGYNGTVMAYGQTGTGKTFTLGKLGEDNIAARGIMVRAMEDILSDTSPTIDSVSVSYFQLYMETIQDLLCPGNDNIAIVEDPKSGDVSIPAATVVEIRDQRSFLELLRIGEAHRFAANTKLNTESSRSHAILMVHVKRSIKGRHDGEEGFPVENGQASSLVKSFRPPIVRKSKLVIVDLAGSERIDKSGSEGHTLEEAKSINLSLTALGKCINALAENSAHVPFRDSKLTRLLRDSFGGTARTSLVVTIGPSPRHRGETSSTIMFGQRAMKVENMVKLKEEFDYKSLCRRLDVELDKLFSENERLQKDFEDEIERVKAEAQNRISEVERKYMISLENERLKYQQDYMDSIKKLEEKWMINQQISNNERFWVGNHEGFMDGGEASVPSTSDSMNDDKQLVKTENLLRQSSEDEVSSLKSQVAQWKRLEAAANAEIVKLNKKLESEAHQKEKLEEEINILKNRLLQLSFEADETRRSLDRGGSGKAFSGFDTFMSQARSSQIRDSANGQKASIAKLFEQVGLQKILSLLESEDADVRIHAVKVVANLAAEEANQEKIVEAGGLSSLLILLRSSEDETIRRVAAGAIANLAMNETNQELVMVQDGISLLSMTAADAEDPQTLRMVAGAIANLCGNGNNTGRSLLIEDGALPWIVKNANNEASPIRRHIELALCHLAQHEVNAKDMINEGALWELVRISRDCSREDIRMLAHKTLTASPKFQAELRRLRIEC